MSALSRLVDLEVKFRLDPGRYGWSYRDTARAIAWRELRWELMEEFHGAAAEAKQMALSTRAPLSVKAIADCFVKSADDASTFVFYASVYNVVDNDNDVVVGPAPVKNVDEFIRDGWIALSHATKESPIAYPIDAIQDSKGFRVEAKWHSTPAAQAARTVVRERLRAGKNVQSSIGYRAIDASPGTWAGRPVRLLRAINVYEASIVNLASNTMAGVVSA
jgi:HK97 family phage prohead protease